MAAAISKWSVSSTHQNKYGFIVHLILIVLSEKIGLILQYLCTKFGSHSLKDKSYSGRGGGGGHQLETEKPRVYRIKTDMETFAGRGYLLERVTGVFNTI